MDIRGAQIHRTLNQLIHPLDDRRLAGQISQMLYKFIIRRIESVKSIEVALFLVLRITLQGCFDVSSEPEPQLDTLSCGEMERLLNERVLRFERRKNHGILSI